MNFQAKTCNLDVKISCKFSPESPKITNYGVLHSTRSHVRVKVKTLVAVHCTRGRRGRARACPILDWEHSIRFKQPQRYGKVQTSHRRAPTASP